MTDTLELRREPSPASLKVRYRLTPWWVKVLVVFVASRVVSTIVLLAFAGIQPANPWTPAHPHYMAFAGIWDGTWYQFVGATGYPSVLPLTSDGHITQNTWAFLPAYPYLVHTLQLATGLTFNVVGVFVSVGFAAGAALVVYKLLVSQLGSSTALFSVVLFCVAPLSPIMQVDYAESMFLFFLALALYFLQKRRYWTMLPFVAVMSFTRPGGLAFALTMGLHVIYRWTQRKRDPFPSAQVIAAVVATVASLALGYAWPAIAGWVTGVPDAYTATELSWRWPYVGWAPLVPFSPWVQGALWWLGRAGVAGTVIPIVLLVVVLGLFAALMFSPQVKRIGVDLRLWIASWTLYILAVFFPQSSVFRMFMPVFPLVGPLAIPRSTAYRVGIVILMIAGQIGWVYIAYWFDGIDWTPP